MVCSSFGLHCDWLFTDRLYGVSKRIVEWRDILFVIQLRSQREPFVQQNLNEPNEVVGKIDCGFFDFRRDVEVFSCCKNGDVLSSSHSSASESRETLLQKNPHCNRCLIAKHHTAE
ncbi:hypothetical protein T10_4419 [Trichinella papuae]|uniref:Uncharacterized protein n=1 Tax=Trichinella papuae TaxID=268474 RepID=A0A0V1M7B9_9BILA|nr:hypothetical protein T10_4419 [Trichinella papuae]